MRSTDQLLTFLRKKNPREFQTVVMPDFFLDRLIDLDCDPSQISSMIKTAAGQRGGSVDGIPQMDIRGGNAVNTASALAALGANVTPLICTDKTGLRQIKAHLKSPLVDLSHAKILPRASLTTALEFKTEKGKTNLMLRDVGSLSDFGPKSLTEHDYQLIDDADYVCVFNWAGTKTYGTELAESVFSRVKAKGKGKTYLDTADPAPNATRISDLVDRILKARLVDVLSLNENEAITYAGYFERNLSAERKTRDFSHLALDCARTLAKCLPTRIDLHTTDFSATLTKETEVIMPALQIKPLRATGAGDAWNAGNILGDANVLSAECRLALANSVSAFYLSDPEGSHPTRKKLVEFVKDMVF